ncbi:MAG: hypothetical protein HN356_15205, partial [Calditrichaeota bacterium]|nr:hypothetical protein [Calditrichota bacterium]
MSPDLFAQEHENVEQVGRIYNHWDNADDICVVGDLAYVAAGFSGLQIVDVSDPENMRVVGYWDKNPSNARKVAVSVEYVYLSDHIGGLQ